MTTTHHSHPLVEQVVDLCQVTAAGPSFDSEALGRLTDRMLEVTDGEELYGLVTDLASYAMFLSQEHGEAAGVTALMQAMQPVVAHLDTLALGDAAKHSDAADQRAQAARRATEAGLADNRQVAEQLSPTSAGVSLRGGKS